MEQVAGTTTGPTGQATPPADAGTTTPTPTEGATTTAPATEAGQVAGTTAAPAEITVDADSQQELAKLTAELARKDKALQSQGKVIKDLKAGATTPARSSATVGKLRENPLLADLPWDVDAQGNDVVEVDDMFYTPQAALRIMQQQEELAELRGEVGQITQARQEAAESERLQPLFGATYDAMDKMLTSVFPEVKGDDRELIQNQVWGETLRLVAAEVSPGEIPSAEIISTALTQSVANARRLASISANAQLAANTTAAAQQPVGTGGVVPMPGPVEYTKMTEEHRRVHGVAIADRILARKGIT